VRADRGAPVWPGVEHAPALATHLVLGGGLWLDGPGDGPADPVLALARAQRDLIGLPTGRVAVVADKKHEALVLAAIAQLEAAHIQFEVIGPDPVDRPELRRSAFELIVRPEDLPDPGLVARINRALPVDREAHPPVLPAEVQSDLPPSVLIERHKLPARNALVHHLVNRGPGPVVGATLSSTAWALGSAGQCRATWFTPASPEGTPLPCARGHQDTMELRLPPLTTWAIVLTEPDLPADEQETTGAPIRLRPEDPMPGSVSLQMDVPAWAPGIEEITLFLPERLEADDGTTALALENRPVYTMSEDDTHLVAVAGGPELELRVEAVGRADRVDVSLEVSNKGGEVLADVRALVCLESKPAGAFPREGQERMWAAGPDGPVRVGDMPEDHGSPTYREIDPPWYGLTMLESIDRRWVMGQVFEEGEIVGGNAGRTHLCVHSRPAFGDIAPGKTSRRRGRIFLRHDTAEGVQVSYEAAPLEPLPPRPAPIASPYRRPCR